MFFQTVYYLLKKKSTIQSNVKKALFENSSKKVTVRNNGKEKSLSRIKNHWNTVGS